MGITSQKIAELAGVSRGTVDRALNHRGGVKPQVQRRIEELARQHGYSPNRAGKALVTREPLRVEVLLNSLGNPFYDEVKQGLPTPGRTIPIFPSTSISGKARATTWPRSSPKSRRRPLPTPPG